MKRKPIQKKDPLPVYRLDPSQRLCPIFDETGIATFPVADPGEMGMRVVDNCPEEHIQ